MGASVLLYRGIEKTINNRDIDSIAKQEKLAELFIKSGYMLPGNFMEDLFQYYIDQENVKGQNIGINLDQLRELAYHFVDIIDLFDMDYDDVKDPLTLEEWITIKDLFSSYAENIDDELLTYVMKFAIEKGAFR
ncbi:MAG: hypothetical protein J7L71_08505 [Spirochaetaceae bacterium]|nr:hypothetical protein [Spirochaetaceae bacterium]